jgi:NAD(P)H-dependent FMN reductase
MPIKKPNIFAIMGSASSHSANEKLLEIIAKNTSDFFSVEIFTELKSLPPFDPELSVSDPPPEVLAFREKIEQCDGVLICTPEYVFSIPAGLKNAIEWCVATTVFSDKPAGIIPASASGVKGHEELQLIMRTVQARFNQGTTLLIQGIKAQVTESGLKNEIISGKLDAFIKEFRRLINGEPE